MLRNSQTIQAVSYEVLLRTQKAQKRIRFRTGRKNLGWVPFNGQTVKYCGDNITYNSFKFRLWEHRKLPAGSKIKTGSFAEDSRGRWYLNLTIMAKGVLDAGWYQIFTFLQYKSLRRGGIVLKVSEKFSTVTCSSCLSRCGPSGLSGLSIREWTCQSCGAVHDRDINSAEEEERRMTHAFLETLVKDTQILPAPRALVFARLLEWTAYPDWNPYITRIDGQPLLGQTIKPRFSMGFGPAMKLNCQVAILDHSKTTLAWDYKAFIPWLYTARHSFILEDSPTGASIIIQTEAIKGLMAAPLFGFFHKLLQRRFQTMHAALIQRVTHAAA